MKKLRVLYKVLTGKPIIVGVGHISRQGKDTFTDILGTMLETSALDVSRIAYADALKQIYNHSGAIDKNTLEHMKNTDGVTRDEIISMATKIRDTLGEDVFLNPVKNLKDVDVLLVSDLRFPEEFKQCDLTINILRDYGATKKAVYPDDLLIGYPFDIIIYNSTNIEDLHIITKKVANSPFFNMLRMVRKVKNVFKS